MDMEEERDITITVEMEKKKVHRNTIPGASKGGSTTNVLKSLFPLGPPEARGAKPRISPMIITRPAIFVVGDGGRRCDRYAWKW